MTKQINLEIKLYKEQTSIKWYFVIKIMAYVNRIWVEGMPLGIFWTNCLKSKAWRSMTDPCHVSHEKKADPLGPLVSMSHPGCLKTGSLWFMMVYAYAIIPTKLGYV